MPVSQFIHYPVEGPISCLQFLWFLFVPSGKQKFIFSQEALFSGEIGETYSGKVLCFSSCSWCSPPRTLHHEGDFLRSQRDFPGLSFEHWVKSVKKILQVTENIPCVCGSLGLYFLITSLSAFSNLVNIYLNYQKFVCNLSSAPEEQPLRSFLFLAVLDFLRLWVGWVVL